MRRCLHSLLVGVLTFSLSIDAARACGHLRHWRRCQPVYGVPVVVVVDTTGWDACGVGPACTADIAWACGGSGAAVVSAGCEEIACGAPLECCGAVAADVTAPAEAVAAAAVGESVIAPPPVAPAPVAPEPVASAVPKLEPVEPVTALEPAAEPVAVPPTQPALTMPVEAALAEAAPAPAEPPTEIEPPAPEPELRPEPPTAPQPEAEPKPRNIFQEVDETAAVEPDALPAQAADEVPVADSPVDLGDTEPASDAAVPADQPAVDEPVMDEPVMDEPAMDEPTADDPDPAASDFEPTIESDPAASAEPLRRWIDDTASYAVVGRLVDVRGDTVEIAKPDGRSVTVPLARLSGFDRDYVAEAGSRVAAARQRGPHPRETASR